MLHKHTYMSPYHIHRQSPWYTPGPRPAVAGSTSLLCISHTSTYHLFIFTHIPHLFLPYSHSHHLFSFYSLSFTCTIIKFTLTKADDFKVNHKINEKFKYYTQGTICSWTRAVLGGGDHNSVLRTSLAERRYWRS